MFEIPDNLDGLDLDGLTGLETNAVAAFDELKADPDLDAEGLATLKKLAAFIKDVRSKQGELQAAADAVRQEVDDLDSLVHGDPDDGTDGDEQPNDQADDIDESDGGNSDADNDGDGELAPAGKQPAVVASVGRAAARQRKPVPKANTSKSARVLAAANLVDKAAKSPFRDSRELADAFASQFAAFPNHHGEAPSARTRIKNGVARIELPIDEEFVVGSRAFDDDYAMVEALASQHRLSGGNVIAAGGWCALNDRLWDLCPGLESADGLWDLPTGTLRRPGVQYPAGLSFYSLYSAIGFHQVEADSIAGTPKPCWDMPCPTFPEQRTELDGICVRQDIVANAFWPEWTRDAIRRATAAHDHKINARLLAQAFAAVGVGNPAGSTAFALPLGSDMDNDETTTGVMGAVAMVATHIRYQSRTLRNYVVEGVAPMWLLDWIRADMARRKGVNFFDISDEQINAWFLRRKVRMQWLYDLQDGFTDVGGVGFGGTTPPTQWPTSVQILLYPAGTYTKLQRPIIDLSAIYDSTSLEDNEYTAVFSEQATLLLKRCFSSYKATIPLCPTGSGPVDLAFDCSAA